MCKVTAPGFKNQQNSQEVCLEVQGLEGHNSNCRG